MPAPPLLSVNDLTVAFPRAVPIRRLSFDVAAGKTLAIVANRVRANR